MNTFIIIYLCLAVVNCLPLDVHVDENGQEFFLIPVHREKRQLSVEANQGGFGVGHKSTLLNDGNHRLDGTVGASKAWGSHGLKPDSYNGRLDYTNKGSGSRGFVSADRTPGWGTDVNAGIKQNIAHGKNWGADVSGQYGRHFGGPGGTGRPQGGVFLNYNRKFK